MEDEELKSLDQEQLQVVARLRRNIAFAVRVLAQIDGALPRTQIHPPGVWAPEWGPGVEWVRGGVRRTYGNPNYPTSALTSFKSEQDYIWLIQYGYLRHLQAVWAQLEPRLAALRGALEIAAEPPVPPPQPAQQEVAEVAPQELPEPPTRYERNKQKLLRLMVDHLVAYRDADLTAPGARDILASRAGIHGTSLSNWFNHCPRTLKQTIAELLPAATELADQELRRRHAS